MQYHNLTDADVKAVVRYALDLAYTHWEDTGKFPMANEREELVEHAVSSTPIPSRRKNNVA